MRMIMYLSSLDPHDPVKGSCGGRYTPLQHAWHRAGVMDVLYDVIDTTLIPPFQPCNRMKHLFRIHIPGHHPDHAVLVIVGTEYAHMYVHEYTTYPCVHI